MTLPELQGLYALASSLQWKSEASALSNRKVAVRRRVRFFGRFVIWVFGGALSASSASVLAGHVGQVMLVVRADRTGESELRDAVALLDGCEHLQLVINSVAFQPGGRRFGGYYGQESAA